MAFRLRRLRAYAQGERNFLSGLRSAGQRLTTPRRATTLRAPFPNEAVLPWTLAVVTKLQPCQHNSAESPFERPLPRRREMRRSFAVAAKTSVVNLSYLLGRLPE